MYCHDLLIRKLERIGIRGGVLKWFASYLSNRKQCVQLKNHKSDYLSISTGVPQGSVLGPLLFNIYINDMKNACGGLKCIQFADDTTLYATGRDINSLVSDVNFWLVGFDSWLRINKLTLNIDKTFGMIISNRETLSNPHVVFRGESIKIVKKIKFLGILIDDGLKFTEHVNNTHLKISRAIGAIRRIRPCINDCILRKLYYSLVYPHINYGIVVWGNSSNLCINKMCSLQRRFMRMFSQNAINYAGEMFTYNSIYEYFTCIKFYKCFNLGIHSYFTEHIRNYVPVHSHRTRFTDNERLNLPRHRLASSQKCFLYSSIKVWNTLPMYLRNLSSMNSFKSNLKLHILNNQFIDRQI